MANIEQLHSVPGSQLVTVGWQCIWMNKSIRYGACFIYSCLDEALWGSRLDQGRRCEVVGEGRGRRVLKARPAGRRSLPGVALAPRPVMACRAPRTTCLSSSCHPPRGQRPNDVLLSLCLHVIWPAAHPSWYLPDTRPPSPTPTGK